MRRNIGLLPLLLAFMMFEAGAQTTNVAPSERAQRDADKVFHWIMIHSDKPRRARTDDKPAPERPAAAERAAAGARPPARPAAPEKDEPAEPAQSLAAARPGSAARTAPAPAAAETVAPQDSMPSETVAVALPSAPPPEPATVDRPLVLVHQVDPEFSPITMRNLRQGSVVVRFEVKPDGTVGESEIVKTSNRRLNSAAQVAVAQWRFQPLEHTQYGIVELAFNLD